MSRMCVPACGRTRSATPPASVISTTAVHTAGSRSAVEATTTPATSPASPRSRLRVGARRPSVSDSSSTTTSSVGPDRPARRTGERSNRSRGPAAFRRASTMAVDRSGWCGQQPTGAGGVAGVGQPLRPVPVGRGLDAGEDHHRQVGGPVEGGRLAHERAGDRQRRRPVTHDADHPASRQVERDGAAGQRRRLVEQGGQRLGRVCGLQRGRLGHRDAPGHVADTGAEVQEVGVAGSTLPQRHAGQLDPAHDLGRIGVGERSPAALVVGRRVQPVGELGELAGEPLALAPLGPPALALGVDGARDAHDGREPGEQQELGVAHDEVHHPGEDQRRDDADERQRHLALARVRRLGPRDVGRGHGGRAGRGGRLNGMVPAGPVCRRGS